jgi:hypothetical protein
MNYKKIILFLLIINIAYASRAQLVFNLPTDDTTTKPRIELGAYVDTYFGYDFNQPQNNDRPYTVSYSRANEVNVNLAYISLKYISDRARLTFKPGFGTYMNANYAGEKGTLQNIVEAYAGFRPFAKKDVWVDVGVLPSPYTNESATSFDQAIYSRTIGAENTPYYITGARISLPVSTKVNANLYLLNGWQVISHNNKSLAFGSNVEYKPTDKWVLDWDTYIGNEGSVSHPDFKTRYYADLYATYTASNKVEITGCIYSGMQRREMSITKEVFNSTWWQANALLKYSFNKWHALAVRAEYFNDSDRVMVVPITGNPAFSTFSESVCYNWNISKQMMVRLEARYYQSPENVYLSSSGHPCTTDMLMLFGVVAKF